MKVCEQLRYVREFCEHRGTRSQCYKPNASRRLRQSVEDMSLYPADMAIAAQIVSHGSDLRNCAALIRLLPIKRPSNGQNLTRGPIEPPSLEIPRYQWPPAPRSSFLPP